MLEKFDTEVERTLAVLRSGGVILYPTDTVWGVGCHALDEKALQKIRDLKNRPPKKNMIVLLADVRDILQYVAAPHPAVFSFLEEVETPTTIIFQNAINLPAALVADDGSIAIRIVADPFCRHLVKRLRAPLVSTSANFSGAPAPARFTDVAPAIIAGVDYVVQWRQQDNTPARPSRIVTFTRAGNAVVLRP